MNGVYPRADVTLAAEIENTAVNAERPVLFRVRVLDVDVVSEKSIDDTKLFGFVVSVDEIVIEPAPVEIETFVPAVKLESV